MTKSSAELQIPPAKICLSATDRDHPPNPSPSSRRPPRPRRPLGGSLVQCQESVGEIVSSRSEIWKLEEAG